MKNLRIVSLLLALLMLCGTAVLFSSCGGVEDGAVTLSGDEVEIDLSEYTIVYAASFFETKTLVDYANQLKNRITEITGAKIGSAGDNTATQESPKEILIGLTTRKESSKVQKGISGDGFAIEMKGDKIVIAGTSNMHLVMAMEYFSQKYLKGATSSKIKVYESACAEKMASVVLGETDGTPTPVVCEDNVITQKTAGSSAAGQGMDVPGVLANVLIDTAAPLIKVKKKSYFPLKKSGEEASAIEVLVGRPDRDVVWDCLAELSPVEYGFFVREGKFVLTSYNDAALLAAKAPICALLEDAVVEKDGVFSIVFPEGFSLIAEAENAWVTDFPKPEGEGITLYNTMENTDNSLQYYYTGEGVSAESYRAYCKQLTDAGYTVLTQNEIEQSLFVTLVDPTNTFSLYVAYNAYAHADEFPQYANNKYDAQYQKCIRVVSSPLDSVHLPDEGLLTPNPVYERVTTSAITAFELYKDTVGMGYVITLEDGRLVLFDGGFVLAPAPDDLWSLLCATNERITGKPTSKENPVRIAAWVLTHSHSDHSSAFLKVLSRFGGMIRMDYMLGNFPTETALYRTASGDILDMGKEGMFEKYQAYVPGGFKYVKVHAGQKFHLANLEIEVLTTFEDLNPAHIYTGNDTNTVTRVTMNNTNESGERVGDPVTIVWLGDANALQSRHLCTMFGDYLESDMVQLAHHGNTGCEKDLYTLVNAKVLWFPVDYWRVELFAIGNKYPTLREINLHALTLPRMQYVFVSGNDNELSDDYNLCLPFSAVTGEPDYDGIYEAVRGEALSYDYVSAYDNVDRFVQAKG